MPRMTRAPRPKLEKTVVRSRATGLVGSGVGVARGSSVGVGEAASRNEVWDRSRLLPGCGGRRRSGRWLGVVLHHHRHGHLPEGAIVQVHPQTQVIASVGDGRRIPGIQRRVKHRLGQRLEREPGLDRGGSVRKVQLSREKVRIAGCTGNVHLAAQTIARLGRGDRDGWRVLRCQEQEQKWQKGKIMFHQPNK